MAYGVRQVPQNIMSVEFKIFDFMTLKQFGISVVLLLVCFALFSFLPTPWNIVLPLFIIIIGGIVIFVPFNGEPFQEFLSSYLEAMISPQRRIWHKKGIVLKSAAEKAQYYRYGADGPTEEKVSNFTFFDRFKKKNQEAEKLDKDEEKFLTAEDTTKGYKPPAKHMPISQNQDGNGTVVSPKSIHNSTNISGFTSQSQAPVQQPVQQNQQVVQVVQNVNPQQPQITNQVSQPSFLKQETQTTSTTNIQHQPKLTPEEEETAVRNFIFGSVEGYEEKPIAGAAIVLKNLNDETLEVFYSNAVGEFKSSYEYIAGKYKIFVNAESKDFNEIIFDHNPVDPAPLTILPKDYKEKVAQKAIEEGPVIDTNSEDGVFTGSYDANTFNLGQNYLEEIQAPQQTQIQQISQLPQVQNANPNFLTTENNLSPLQEPTSNQIPTSAPTADLIEKTSTYSHNASNMFDQMMNNRMTNDYGATPTPPQPQKVINDVQFLDFLSMPNAAVPFEQNLVSLPNTVNGILVDPNGYGLGGALVRLFDPNGVLITSMNSDNTGRFYTYSPLPSNNYVMYISKNDQNLVGFNVTMNGSVIAPKIISFTY